MASPPSSRQLLAHLRPDELDPAQLHRPSAARSGPEDAVAEIGAASSPSCRGDANQHVARGPEVLHGGAWEAASARAARTSRVPPVLVSHLDQGAAGEIEPEIEAAQCHRTTRSGAAAAETASPPGACP